MAAALYTIFFFNLLLVVVIKCLITCFHSSLPRNGRPSTRLNRQRQPEPVAARRGVKCFRVPAFAKACVPWRQPRIRLWLPRITQQCSSSLDRGKWRFSPSFFFVYILSIIFNLQGANFEKKRMEHRAASQQLLSAAAKESPSLAVKSKSGQFRFANRFSFLEFT